MKSWKTTLCGILAICGAGLTQFFHEYPLVFKIGGFLAAVAPAIGLLFARDNNVSSQSLGLKPTAQPVKVTNGKPNIAPLAGFALLAALGLALGLAGCRSLEPGGAYQSDPVLYQSELTTVTAYDVIHTFVKWEYENREALATWPDIRKAADTMRRGAKDWFATAYALRDAYQLEPTAEKRLALEKALAVLRAALQEAARHMAQASETTL